MTFLPWANNVFRLVGAGFERELWTRGLGLGGG
jgi:hypothetical protein